MDCKLPKKHGQPSRTFRILGGIPIQEQGRHPNHRGEPSQGLNGKNLDRGYGPPPQQPLLKVRTHGGHL